MAVGPAPEVGGPWPLRGREYSCQVLGTKGYSLLSACLELALGAIVVAARLFANVVEILGRRLSLGEGAVGSLLAAVGTALPETMIPVVSVLVSVLNRKTLKRYAFHVLLTDTGPDFLELASV